jgi:hypothetical protein
VSDSGWKFSDKEQTVLVRNRVNASLMARGYAQLTRAAFCREQTNTLGYGTFTQLWMASQWRANAVRCENGMACAQRFGVAARAQADLNNAATDCKAERAESASEFRSRYANRRGQYAFARCVASKADPAPPFLSLKFNARR